MESDPVALVRGDEVTQMLLALYRYVIGEPVAADLAMRADPNPLAGADTVPSDTEMLNVETYAAKRLKRWHQQLVRRAAHYAELDEEARHGVRKRAKRLRYGVEFVASLFGRKEVRRYLKLLGLVQEKLGLYNDATVAEQLYREAIDNDPRAWFAVGWLSAQRRTHLDECIAVLTQFAAHSKPFWKGA